MSFRNYYDTSYGRNRDAAKSSSSTGTDRPTSVTAKYTTTPSYKSSSIPVLSAEKNDKEKESPITAIANKYAHYNKTEKPASKYEKKDYSKLSVPSISTTKSRDPSPVSTSKYSLTRPSRHLSPERRTAKSFKDKSRDTSPGDRDKNIPSKTDKSTGYNSLSSYKLYPRSSSYTRPSTRVEPKSEVTISNYSRPSRTDTKPDITVSNYSRPSSRTDAKSEATLSNYSRPTRTDPKPDISVSNYTRPCSRTDSKPEITVNRYAIANRLSSNYLRSPPTVKRTSVSPVNHIEIPKRDTEKSVSPIAIVEEPQTEHNNTNISNENIVQSDDDNETETISIVTRHTSPTPPGSSSYVRSRRADMAKTIEKTITRLKKRPETADKEIQSDRLDDPTRTSRFGSTARTSMSNWSYYSPNVNSYTGYAGRYSTQYSNLNTPNSSYNDRSRSHSREPQPKDNSNASTYSDNSRDKSSAERNLNPELQSSFYEQNKGDDTSEIIINVNLKLKRAKSPSATELVSPEITVTNSQLPPQAPKAEGAIKTKKLKVRKTSSDSLTDSSSKKKIVKKRSKSVSSTDSDQASEVSDKASPPKSITRNSSSSNLANGSSKLKHSKSRESNSPESSITLSTQSSISEDDISKSKTNDHSRTSADEKSLSMDRSGKQPSPIPQKIENGTEEAKSFLIRALAPVTNLFKMRQSDSSDSSRLLETSMTESTSKDVSNLVTESEKSSKSKNNTNNIIASNDDNLVQLKGIRPLESDEIARWLDSESSNKKHSPPSNDSMKTSSDKNIPRKIRHIESGERAWWLESNSENKSGNQIQSTNSTESSDPNKPIKKFKFVEEEKPWWLDSCANIPEGIERLTPPRKSSSDSEKSDKFNFFKARLNDSGDQKDWWLTSNENSLTSNKPDTQSLSKSESERNFPLRRIRHVESGERPWWLCSDKNIPEGIEKLPPPPPQEGSESSDSEEVQVYSIPSHIPPFPLHLPDDEPLGDRRSPEGLETPNNGEDYRGRSSPYENDRQFRRRSSDNSYQKGVERYISRYTDIDDILGTSGQIYSPFMDSILARRTGQMAYEDEECEEIDPTQVRIHDSTAQRPVIKKVRSRSDIIDCRDEDQVSTNRVNGEMRDIGADSFVCRVQYLNDLDPFMEDIVREPPRVLYHTFNATLPLSYQIVAVHRLLQAPHRLDDATLQVFKDGDYGPYLDLDSTLCEQEEELEGMQECRKNALILRTQLSVRVHTIIDKLRHSHGRELRRALFALKQVLQSDKDLVHEFVANKGLDCLMQVGNMADHNYLDYILRALGQILLYVDGMHGVMEHKPCVQWLYSLISSKFRHIVKTALKLLLVFVEYTEKNSLLLIDAIVTVDSQKRRQPWYIIMKILQDFDASDSELLIYATTLINRCLNNVPDRDTYYDQVDALQDQGMDNIIQLYMNKQGTDLDLLRQLQVFEAVLLFEDGDESGTALKQLDESVIKSVRVRSLKQKTPDRRKSKKQELKEKEMKLQPIVVPGQLQETKPSLRPIFNPPILDNMENKELSTALKRRRDRSARQQEMLNNASCNIFKELLPSSVGCQTNTNENHTKDTHTTKPCSNLNRNVTGASSCAIGNSSRDEDEPHTNRTAKSINLGEVLKNGNQRYTSGLKQRIQNGTLGNVTTVDAVTVIRQKMLDNPPETVDDREVIMNREHSIKDLAQRLTRTVSPTTEEKPLRVSDMAGIVSKAKEELAKSQSKEVIKCPAIEKSSKVIDIKASENDLHWEELRKGCLNRVYQLCDLDFSDLHNDSDDDMLSPAVSASNGPPPPPPGWFPPVNAPPPPMPKIKVPAPPKHVSDRSNDSDSSTIKKNKKTVKLFWKEIQENPAPSSVKNKTGGFIWDDLPEIKLDTAMLEHLFESRTNDLIIKKLMEPKRNLILDAKRSNAINIAMKKLPTPQTIKAAIMKMDATVIGREGIEKLLTMLPTEEEKVKIQEAQYANPDLPLGSAEQFLLTLASINELSSRLKLWVFKLDFDNLEKEMAEPLMDLKLGIELLKANLTFKVVLSTLRSVGSFLNGSLVKGFRLEYLSKVMEVKDTVHKHPLLYHICEMIIDKFPDTTDFFSEVGPVIRASKVDFDNLNANLLKLESDCKASWDHMTRVAKHDSSQIFKTKINEFLTDAAERIIMLKVIKKKVMTRYNKFLLYLGVPSQDIAKTKPSQFLKVIAEFALEYRTTRERVLQQLEKRANHRERNKTRGKMIIDVGNFSNKNGDHTADSALKELLKTDPDTDSLTKGRRKPQSPANKTISVNGDLSADEEIIETLVRSATSKRRSAPRERRKNRISDSKHWNRTLDGHQSWPGRESSPGSTAEAQQR